MISAQQVIVRSAVASPLTSAWTMVLLRLSNRLTPLATTRHYHQRSEKPGLLYRLNDEVFASIAEKSNLSWPWKKSVICPARLEYSGRRCEHNVSLPGPPVRGSASLPPLIVSVPPPPDHVRTPRPAKTSLAPLPVIMFSAAYPVPSILLVPVASDSPIVTQCIGNRGLNRIDAIARVLGHSVVLLSTT